MLNEPGEALLAALKAAAGPGGWREGDDLAPYLSEPRGLFQGRAALALRPGTTTQVAEIIRLCNQARVGVAPYGGGTGLVGGQVKPDGPAPILLSTERLNAIRAADPVENALTVEAGVTVAEAHAAAEAVDRLFPLSYASEGTATIGGGMAVNSGGLQALRYGVARDVCLGLEVVTAQGEIWNGLTTLKKDNTGFDLRNLFIGSEGALGVICAATLKLFPRPRARVAAFIGVQDPGAALSILNRAQDESFGSAAVAELMPRIGLDFVFAHRPQLRDPLAAPAPWYLLLELWGAEEDALQAALEATLTPCLENGEALDAVLAVNESQRQTFRDIRETLPHSQKPQGGSIKHDISLPLGQIPSFLERADAVVKAMIPGARPCPFGHLGDGNLHYNITQPERMDPAAFLARWAEVNDAVHEVVCAMGGSISAEHGIGRLKSESLKRFGDPVKYGLGLAVKAALDPVGIMNPGVIHGHTAPKDDPK